MHPQVEAEELDRFFSLALDLLCIADTGGHFRRLNQSWETVLGYSLADMEGKRFLDFVHPDDIAATLEAVEKLTGGQIVLNFVNRYRCKDGSYRWIEWRSAPYGELIYAAARDITERKQTEEALRRSEEHFRALFETNPFPILITSVADGAIIQANQALLDYMEGTREDLGKVRAPDFYRISTDRQTLIAEVKAKGCVRNKTVELQTIHGQIRYALVNILPIEFNGELCMLAGMADITERMQMEEALRQAKEAAEAASHAKSAFLANISHELRTPLNAVLGFSELILRDPNLTPEQRENMNLIAHSGEHLLGLINTVLNLSKIETGHAELHLEALDLHEMLRDLTEMFRSRAEEKGVTVRLDLAPDTPRYIHADINKLSEVLINLLSNAVKFTEHGEVTLQVNANSSDSQPSDSTRLHFEIKDTGIGIAPDELEKVFEAFVQTESGRQSRQGTGLGLPISREYVRLMGGDLTVHSELGVGSVFAFDIQIEVAQTQPERNSIPAKRQIIGTEPGQPTYRILIAEDDPINRKLLNLVLAPLGLNIREAVNGVEAVEIWESWQPHLIFMDMRMPEMDGHEATQKIKAKIPTQKSGVPTVIVALTASAFEEERDEFLAAGCDDFVRKPFNEAEIFEILGRHLGIRYTYATPDESESPSDKHVDQVVERLAMQAVRLEPAWAADMERAVLEGDMEWMETLTLQIQDKFPAFAGHLAQLIYNFEHDEILRLIHI